MADTFSIWSDELVDNTPITGNGSFTLITSNDLPNANNFNSLRMVIEYKITTPASNDRNFDITAVVESSNEVNPTPMWYPIAYQFNSFRRDIQGTSRILILQPNMSTFDTGVDDVVFVAGERARISRQQGKLGGEFRLRIAILESGFGGPGGFQDMLISAYGERFNA